MEDTPRPALEVLLHIATEDGVDFNSELSLQYYSPTFTEEGEKLYGVATCAALYFCLEQGVVELYFEDGEHPKRFKLTAFKLEQ